MELWKSFGPRKTGDSPRAGVQVSTTIICISIMKPEGRVKSGTRHVEVEMRAELDYARVNLVCPVQLLMLLFAGEQQPCLTLEDLE
jgi:hypothetical protein